MLTCGRFKGNAYIYSQLLDLAVLILASWRRQAAAAKQILQRCLKGIKFADRLGFSKAMVWSVLVDCSQTTSLMQLVSSLFVATGHAEPDPPSA